MNPTDSRWWWRCSATTNSAARDSEVESKHCRRAAERVGLSNKPLEMELQLTDAETYGSCQFKPHIVSGVFRGATGQCLRPLAWTPKSFWTKRWPIAQLNQKLKSVDGHTGTAPCPDPSQVRGDSPSSHPTHHSASGASNLAPSALAPCLFTKS